MKANLGIVLSCILLTQLSSSASDFGADANRGLTNFDVRIGKTVDTSINEGLRGAAKEKLRTRVPDIEIRGDDVTGAPGTLTVRDGFLTGANGRGRAVSDNAAQRFNAKDPHGPVKAFISEYRDLFGHGPELLDKALIERDYVTDHNGLRTVIWKQQVDGIPVFEGTLIAHITKNGELVSLTSHFLPDPEGAADAGLPNRKVKAQAPTISLERAMALASEALGDRIEDKGLSPLPTQKPGAESIRQYAGRTPGEQGDVRLVWLAKDRGHLRLCWQVALKREADEKIYQQLVDAETGEVLVRRSLTFDLSDATYRVFTTASPAPWTPGPSTPSSAQAPTVSRQLVTLSALDTTASPLGWINDGDNETKGNNVFAYLTTLTDSTRPQGSPSRVFDFPLDLTQSPTTYGNASTVNAFYWCNWMHDRLYQLGFTEAAGNYQKDNIGRGGVDADMMVITAQEKVTENSSFSCYGTADGFPGYIHAYVWPSTEPDRDAALDAQVLLHEYAHAIQMRYCYTDAIEGQGAFEGWSDFFALAMLSQPTDDVNGNYPLGGYVTYLKGNSGFDRNSYFGIRRYPYTTDLSKNPLTYNDICSERAIAHPGVPRSPTVAGSDGEVHAAGEVWCSILWDIRAALIEKYGFATGNTQAMRLVLDGMRLLGQQTYGFKEARDKILQADVVNNGGANRNILWAAFAKRGLGNSAFSQPSPGFVNVAEAYDTPSGTPSLGIYLRGQESLYLTQPMLVTEDFRNLNSFVIGLGVHTSSYEIYLWNRLTPATQQLIHDYVYSGTVSLATVTVPLLSELNAILRGPQITPISGTIYSEEAKWLMGQNPQGGALVRLNRILLSDGLGWNTDIRPIPPFALENSGTLTASGTVRLSVKSATDTVVTLTSSRPDYLTVPATVTIPANQQEATFTVTIVDNSIADGKHYAVVSAKAPGLSSASDTLMILDQEVDHFAFNTPASQELNQPFSVTVTAQDTQNNTVNSYSGPVRLSGWTTNGSSPSVVISKVNVTQIAASSSSFNPSAYIEFANVSSGSINLGNWQIILYDGSSWPNPQQTVVLPSSVSNPGEVFRLTLSPLNLTAYPNVYSNFYSFSTVGWSQNGGSSPLAILVRDSAGQVVDFMCAAGANPSQITVPCSVPSSIWTGAAVPAFSSLPGFYQRKGNADHNDLNDWVSASLNDLIVPAPVLQMPFTSAQSVAVSPTASGSFVNGVWTGNVTASTLANSMYLRADDGSTHAGDSSAFSVGSVNDLSLKVTSSSDRVSPAGLITYTITVSNSGPNTATSVIVTNIAPTGTTVETMQTSQGTCSLNGTVVRCDVGTLAGATSATITLGVRVAGMGTLVNTTSVRRGEADSHLENNAVTTSTIASVPLIFACHTNVVEGNSGMKSLSVTASLSGPSSLPVSFNYATVACPQGLQYATPGTDYVVSSGTITFPAGSTSATIPLQVIGDTMEEYGENFLLVLSSPVNGELAATQYRIQITDDDSSTRPSFAISDTSVTEGDSGTVLATFNITMSAPSGRPQTIYYQTVEDTATEGRDYDGVSGSVVFAPGTTQMPITVPVRGDRIYEGNESFKVVISTLYPITKNTGVCTIIDDDVDKLASFGISTIASPQGQNTPFAVTVTAKNGSGGTCTGFSGNATLNAGVPGQTRAIGIAPQFTLGDIANLTSLGTRLKQPNQNYDRVSVYLRTRLSANTLSLLSSYTGGESSTLRQALITEFNTIIQGASIYDWNNFQYVALRPETDRLRQSNPTGANLIRLNRLLLEDTYTSELAQFEWNYPMGNAFEDQRAQVIYLASEIGQAGQIKAISLYVDRQPGDAISAWTIRMKHTTLSSYSATPQWENTGWTTVYQNTLSVSTTGWLTFNLTTPFTYNGTDNLMIDFSFNGQDYRLDGLCHASTDMQNRSLVTESDSSLGDPLTWGGTTPQPIATPRYPNLNVAFETPATVTPTAIGPFVNGVWTGSITASGLASGMQLRVDDGAGHLGSSNPFDVIHVNQAPSFVKGANQSVLEDVPAQTVTGWATSISPGSGESGQTVNFIVSNDNNALFAVQPAISASGTLTYTLAPNQYGTANVTVTLHDDGGTAAGGIDTSAPQVFTITVTPVNDAPSFVKGPNQTILEDAGAQTITGWATSISPGPANEAGQTLTFVVSNDNRGLFATQPAISSTGTLTYRTAMDSNGTANVTVTLRDSGGTANGGVDSFTQTFTITVLSVNDVPSLSSDHSIWVQENSGSQTIAAYAYGTPGYPADEKNQTINFIVSNNNNALFSVQPSIAPDGTLTFTVAPNQNGTATLSIQLHDNGGTANGGVDTSSVHTPTITVTPATGVAPGNMIWQYRTGYEIWTTPAIGRDGTIYFGSRDGYLYAMNRNGTVKWRYRTLYSGYSFKQSSPTIAADGTIYAGTTEGFLYALNPDGTSKWVVSVGGEVACSPSIGPDGTIYCGSNGGGMRALRPTNGSTIWSYSPNGQNIYSSPAIANDGTIYFGATDRQMHALDSNGVPKWSYTTGYLIASSPAIGADGSIYFGSQDGYVYGLRPDGSLKWSFNTGSSISSSPVIGADGTVYIGSSSMRLYALNPDTGVKAWDYYVQGSIEGAPAIGSDGTIYVIGGTRLWAISPNGTFQWNRAFTPVYSSYSSPVIAKDGVIYFGANTYYIYAAQGNSGPANTAWPMLKHDIHHTGSSVSFSSGLVAWWPMQGNALDVAGTNNGTVVGSASFAAGEVNQAIYMDQKPEGLSVPDNQALNFGAGADFSIEAWIAPQVAATSSNIMDVVDKRFVTNNYQAVGYELCVTNGRLMFQMSDTLNLTPLTTGPSGADLRDGLWHHVAVSVQRTNALGGVFYVDGQPVGTFDPTSKSGSLTTTQPLLIGMHPASWLDCNFRGGIDEVSVYSRALTAAEIKAIYWSGTYGKWVP